MNHSNDHMEDNIFIFYSAFRKAIVTIDHSLYLDLVIAKFIKSYVIIASLAIAVFAGKSFLDWDSLFSIMVLLFTSVLWLLLLYKSVIKYLLFFLFFYLSSKIFHLDTDLNYVLFYIFGVYAMITNILLSFVVHSKIYRNYQLFNDLFRSWQISIRYNGKKYFHSDSDELFDLIKENE